LDVTYLDNCATTHCRSDIVKTMGYYLEQQFGNPSSQHQMGRAARFAVDQAASRIARLIGADPKELVFTSGATESNNLVLLGVFDHAEKAPINAVISPIDHKSTLEVDKELSRRGVEVRLTEVDRRGRVRMESLERLVDEHTKIVSVSWVNSEIGTVQPVGKIAEVCARTGALLHVDAVQAVGRIPVDVRAEGVHALSLSAHKMYGPKGVGALFLDSRVEHRVRPLTFGGGQSRLRSGTIPTHLVVGLGLACEQAEERLASDYDRATRLREVLLEELTERIPDLVCNSDPEVGVPHVVNVTLPGVRSEALITGLRKVAISSGSACNSDSLEPSYVLRAIGLSEEKANCSIRICLNPSMSVDELRGAVVELVSKAQDVRYF
jgi:cysteine desulfurase